MYILVKVVSLQSTSIPEIWFDYIELLYRQYTLFTYTWDKSVSYTVHKDSIKLLAYFLIS